MGGRWEGGRGKEIYVWMYISDSLGCSAEINTHTKSNVILQQIDTLKIKLKLKKCGWLPFLSMFKLCFSKSLH